MACVSGGAYFVISSLRSARISRRGRVSSPGLDSSRDRHFISAMMTYTAVPAWRFTGNEPIADAVGAAVYYIEADSFVYGCVRFLAEVTPCSDLCSTRF